MLFDILTRKTSLKVYSSSTISINENVMPRNPVVTVVFKLPIDKLSADEYRIDIRARESAQNLSPLRTCNFSSSEASTHLKAQSARVLARAVGRTPIDLG